MSTQSTVKEMQNALRVIRRYAMDNDYNLCREWQKNMIMSCAEIIETILIARGWEPVLPDE